LSIRPKWAGALQNRNDGAGVAKTGKWRLRIENAIAKMFGFGAELPEVAEGLVRDMAAAAKSVTASGYYVSMTSPSIAEAGQFFDLMEAAGY